MSGELRDKKRVTNLSCERATGSRKELTEACHCRGDEPGWRREGASNARRKALHVLVVKITEGEARSVGSWLRLLLMDQREGPSERAPRGSEARPETWVCRVPGRTAPGSFSVPENTPCPERMD